MTQDDRADAGADAVVLKGRTLSGDDVRAATTAAGQVVLEDCDLTGESLRGLDLSGWTWSTGR